MFRILCLSLLLVLIATGPYADDSGTLQSLQSLIGKTADNTTLRVPPGIYHGHFFIKKSITLMASRDVIIDGNGKETVLRITAPHVVIDGLIIQNSGSIIGNSDSAVSAENSPGFILRNCILQNTLFGIELLASPNSTIEKNEMTSFKDYPLGSRGDLIKVWYSPEVRILQNHISDGRDVLVWYSDHSTLEGNTIERMRYALHYMYSYENIATHNKFQFSSVGIYDMYGSGLHLIDNEIISNRGPSGYGVALKEADRVKLSGNRLLGNRIGLQLDNSSMNVFELNQIARNDIGVTFVGSGSSNVFLKNDFVDNWQQVSTSGLQKKTIVWTNNYWSDYRGVDPKGTGIGIIPYSADSLTDDLTDRFESFKLFNFGPAMLALEFAQKTIPWFQTTPKAIDSIPAMQPNISIQAAHVSLRTRLSLAMFSIALLGLLVVMSRRLII